MNTLSQALLALAVIFAPPSLNALAAVHYVDVNSTNPTPPYTNWAAAATNIQDAVDASAAGDEVAVTNGVYAGGGRAVQLSVSSTNRVAVDKALVLRSVNGSDVTVIDGRASVRCVYLTNGASLSGFTLTNGLAQDDLRGGGIFCEPAAVVSNSVITGNRAITIPDTCSVAGFGGGGVFGGTLNNCTLAGNGGVVSGGGAYGCTLNGCLVSGNFAKRGGGAHTCVLNKCFVTLNSAGDGGGACSSTLNNCLILSNSAIVHYRPIGPCPQQEGGASGGGVVDCDLNNCTIVSNQAAVFFVSGDIGHIGPGAAAGSRLNNCILYLNSVVAGAEYDNACVLDHCWPSTNSSGSPLFVNMANRDLRLHSNSPCINSGNNGKAVGDTDLDGNPRISGGTVDIGAYEFQNPPSQISYAWLQQFNLPINSLTDRGDPDGDGVDNYHEWLANSDPTDPFSFPPTLALIPYGAYVILTWPTNAVGFKLQSTTNLNSPITWSTNSPAPIVIGGENVIINSASTPQQCYRLAR